MVVQPQTLSPIQIHSSSDTPQASGPMLLLINPISGTRKSQSIYEHKLKPILEHHNIVHQVFTSSDECRVSQYIESLSFDTLISYGALVVVGGDGLFHETLNAIKRRPDSASISLQLPMGIVPGGSGNGLAYTIIFRNNPKVKSAEEGVNIACKQLINFNIIEADLMHIRVRQETIWSFLSVGWGIMADIDIESETLRLLGALRFTLFGLLKSITFRAYKGKLTYKLASSTCQIHDNDESTPTSGDNKTSELQDTVEIDDRFTCVYAVKQSHISRDTNMAPSSTPSDQIIYLTYVRGCLSIKQRIIFLTWMKDGSHQKLPYVTVVPVTSFILEPLEQSLVVVDGENIHWKPADGPLITTVEPLSIKLISG